jgi:predicted DNA-binding transcriptional regulator AlpA
MAVDAKSIAVPRLLRRAQAATYLGVSPSSFDALVKDRVVPPPKLLKTFKVLDARELDEFADNLPRDGASEATGASDWD